MPPAVQRLNCIGLNVSSIRVIVFIPVVLFDYQKLAILTAPIERLIWIHVIRYTQRRGELLFVKRSKEMFDIRMKTCLFTLTLHLWRSRNISRFLYLELIAILLCRPACKNRACYLPIPTTYRNFSTRKVYNASVTQYLAGPIPSHSAAHAEAVRSLLHRICSLILSTISRIDDCRTDTQLRDYYYLSSIERSCRSGEIICKLIVVCSIRERWGQAREVRRQLAEAPATFLYFAAKRDDATTSDGSRRTAKSARHLTSSFARRIENRTRNGKAKRRKKRGENILSLSFIWRVYTRTHPGRFTKSHLTPLPSVWRGLGCAHEAVLDVALCLLVKHLNIEPWMLHSPVSILCQLFLPSSRRRTEILLCDNNWNAISFIYRWWSSEW